MSLEIQHPILGRMVLKPREWSWTGEFDHAGATVELNVNTFNPDQIPGMHVTGIREESGRAFLMVRPQISEYLREAADWICSNLQAVWFEDEILDPEVVRKRLRLSCLVLHPEGGADLNIKDSSLWEDGQTIQLSVDREGKTRYLNMEG